MSALTTRQSGWLSIEVIFQWWRDWVTRGSVSELKCFGEEGINLIAKDVGVSPTELRRLASLGPESVDPMRRMAALDLDQKEVSGSNGGRSTIFS